MRTNQKNSFFRKFRDLLSLSVDPGAVLRELFFKDQISFSEILRRNSKAGRRVNRSQVHYVRGWMILIKP
jgi:hypothetical protein